MTSLVLACVNSLFIIINITIYLCPGRRPRAQVIKCVTGLNNVCACAQLWRAKIGHDNNSIENGGYFKIL